MKTRHIKGAAVIASSLFWSLFWFRDEVKRSKFKQSIRDAVQLFHLAYYLAMVINNH